MAKNFFMLMEVVVDKQPEQASDSQSFLHNFQTAILLSLLERGLLTEWQFEYCVEELQRKSIKN